MANKMKIEIHIAVITAVVVLIAIFFIVCIFFKRQTIKSKLESIKNNGLIFILSFSTILSTVALVVSVHTLYCGCVNGNVCCNSDSIVVAAFGVIVTLLVGWDIYKVIDLNKKIDERLVSQNTEIESGKKYVDEKTKEVEGEFNKTIATVKSELNIKISETKESKNKLRSEFDILLRGKELSIKKNINDLKNRLDKINSTKFNNETLEKSIWIGTRKDTEVLCVCTLEFGDRNFYYTEINTILNSVCM